ncbi:MAG TPA: hypothetical protein GXZ90_06110 [Clostridiales bacterium]|nr:hypothetical protein [Clostridiales bacterium]
MKIWKNLFGNDDKINASEIAVAPGLLLPGAVIVESGDGYTMWGNGLMIVEVEFVRAITTSDIGVHWAASQAFNFPKPFIAPPTLMSCSCNETTFISASNYSGNPTTTQSRLNFHFRAARDNVNITFKIIYWGRWK